RVPIARLAADLNDSLRDRGVVEHLLDYIYLGAGALARFDRYSHILPSYQVAGQCSLYATTPVKGCSAHYAGGNAWAGTAAAKAAAKAASKPAKKKKSASPRVQALDYLLGK